MEKNSFNVAGTVRRAIEPTVQSLGFSIWDVEYVKEGASYYLKVTIDSPNGIDLNACEAVHRAIDPVLDELDPIEEAYILEVSSPGLEREIRTAEHYRLCRGQTVQIKLFRPVDGAKILVGKLDVDDEAEQITIIGKNGSVTVPRKAIAKANIYFEL
jgi:ribosome maturation factor RimP